MPGKAADTFQPGDLVFAKMRGFPHWPARIARGESSKKKVPVFFFGTHQTASIPTENIVTYVGNKGRYGKGVRIRGFTEGMWEIENTPRVCSKQKVGGTPAKKEQADKKPDQSKTSAPVKAPIKAPKTPAKTIRTMAVTALGNKAAPRNTKTSADGQQKTDTPANTRAEKRKKIEMCSTQDEPVQGQKTAPTSSTVIPPVSKKTRLTEEKSSSTTKSKREKTTGERKKQEESRGRKRKKDDEGEKIKEVGVEEGKIEVSKMREVESLETDKEVIHKEAVKKGNEEGGGVAVKRNKEEEGVAVKGNEEEEGGVAVKRNEEEEGGVAVKGNEEEEGVAEKGNEEEEGVTNAVTENSPGQDEERRRRLAARRESVLKSLQGLLTRRKGLRRQSLKPTRTPKNGAGGKKSRKTGGQKRDRKTESKTTGCKTTESKTTGGKTTGGKTTGGKTTGGKTTGGKTTGGKTTESKTTGGKTTESKTTGGKTTGGKTTGGKTTDEKVESTKTEVKKLEGKKTECKKPEQKMEKKVERKKSAEAKKSESTRSEATKSESTRSEAKKAESTRSEATKPEAKKAETEKVERRQEEEPKSPQRGVLGDGQITDSVSKLHSAKESFTLTDSTLHRIHGDIRISLKTDNPDISKCLTALDQLSMVYVTSQHVQRHSELITTLRKMRRFRSNQDVMDKASMLYNRFKNAFLLVNDKDNVISPEFLRSLLEEKEREEEERVERWREKQKRRGEVLQEVRRRMSQLEERRGGEKGVVATEKKEEGLPEEGLPEEGLPEEGLPEDGSSELQ